MYCLVCKELIEKRINYKNIFKKRYDLICDKCFMDAFYIQKLETIPIEGKLLYLNILFLDYINQYSLMNFLKPYYMYYLKGGKNNIIMYFDEFDLKIYDTIHKINMDDIFMIVLKKTIKEKDYED